MSLELRFTTPFRSTPVMRAFRSRMQAGTYLAEFMDDLPAYEFKDPFTARQRKIELRVSARECAEAHDLIDRVRVCCECQRGIRERRRAVALVSTQQ